MEINGNSRNVQDIPASHRPESNATVLHLTSQQQGIVQNTLQIHSVGEAPIVGELMANDPTKDDILLRLAATTAVRKKDSESLLNILQKMNLKTQKAFFEQRNSNGSTMMTKVIKEHPTILPILCQAVTPDNRSELFSAPLMLAKTAKHTSRILTAAKEAGCEKEVLKARDCNGRTALCYAIDRAQGQWKENNLRIDMEGDRDGYDINEALNQISILIDAGASPLDRDPNGNTLLRYAFAQKNLDVVRLLLLTMSAETQVELFKARETDGQTILNAALVLETPEFTDLLLGMAKGVACDKELLEARDHNGQTALFHAMHKAESGRGLENLNILLDAGASPFVQDAEGKTVLMHAVAHKTPCTVKVVQTLFKRLSIENQIDLLNMLDNKGLSACMHAISAENPKMLKALFDTIEPGNRSDLLFRRDPSGKTLLMLAKSKEDMTLLLQVADETDHKQQLLEMHDNNRQTALFHAIDKAQSRPGIPYIQMLLNAGASLFTQDREGKTVLMHAVARNTPCAARVIKTLIEDLTIENRMTLLKMRDKNGLSIFMHAISAKNPQLLRTLFDAIPPRYRSDFLLTHRDPSERTLLMLAQTAEDMAVLLDIAKSVDCELALLDARNSNNETALFDAVRRGIHDEQESINQIKLLLSKSMSPIHMNTDGISAFMLAIEQGQWNIVFALIIGSGANNQGALFNSRDPQGRTPFMYAIEKRQSAIVEKFLEFNEVALLDEFSYRDSEGKTILDYAKKDPIIYALIKPKATFFHEALGFSQEEEIKRA